ncbi:hypothetical protein PRZ48_009445 [Zasmidium cellare]|uniref:Protein kinase domain-containing protein n=1 Tax=Zasmidium cellare TaxID=395010 RepID=A0ABR0EBR1_ZASCE|nr:hypothetical protein PRZ48_009445 [Zasmidium cellare]
MSEPKDDIQLLQASIDPDDDSYFRLLVNGKYIKYITVAAEVYEEDDMCFAPSLIPLLPPFPEGNWNDGYIAKQPDSGKPHFQRTVQTKFPEVQRAWHDVSFNYLDLELGKKLRTNVYEARVTGSQEAVIAKFARFSWEIDNIDKECVAYHWINNSDIGPKFLGNIVEEDRVIGFVIERIADARPAETGDYGVCKRLLLRLHSKGIIHGDINKHNFLVSGTRTVLIDFDCARRTADKKAMKAEMTSLKDQLANRKNATSLPASNASRFTRVMPNHLATSSDEYFLRPAFLDLVYRTRPSLTLLKNPFRWDDVVDTVSIEEELSRVELVILR